MKQAIVVRVDLGMSTGKLAAQACHASVAAAFAARKDDLSRWLGEGQTKVVLQASSLEALFELRERCDALGLAHELISVQGVPSCPRGWSRPSVSDLPTARSLIRSLELCYC